MSSNKEISRFCHSVSTLLESGIDIQQALKLTARQTKKGNLSKVAMRCSEALNEGKSLSAAIGREKRYLPGLVETMVKAGEETGQLNRVFAELAEFYELKSRLWRRFFSQITLPVFQYVAAVLVLTAARYIISFLQEQPAGIAGPLAAGYGIPAGIIFLGWLASRYSSSSRAVHEVLWHTPVISMVVRPLALARFSLCFKFTLGAGMHLKKALNTAFEASGNEAFRARATLAEKAISNGKDLTDALKMTALFDDEYLAVVSVAEESGKTMERMQWLSNSYNEKAETALSVLASVSAKLIWVIVAAFMIYFIFQIFSAYILEMRGLIS